MKLFLKKFLYRVYADLRNMEIDGVAMEDVLTSIWEFAVVG